MDLIYIYCLVLSLKEFYPLPYVFWGLFTLVCWNTLSLSTYVWTLGIVQPIALPFYFSGSFLRLREVPSLPTNGQISQGLKVILLPTPKIFFFISTTPLSFSVKSYLLDFPKLRAWSSQLAVPTLGFISVSCAMAWNLAPCRKSG